MQKLSLKTAKRTELVDITGQIQDMLDKNQVKKGICFIFCPHTTAGLAINENADPSVRHDITGALNKLVPEGDAYTHSEGNSDAHIKSSLLGASLVVFIRQGRLALGAWQGIYFCEGDGPRSREVWIKILKQE